VKIGHGYDAHRLVEGRRLVLGGVTIQHRLGLAGHSDADVVLHAICDAILGALALGDIGRHFPDTDMQYSDVDSRLLLRQVANLMQQQNHQLGNMDVSIVAQEPKLATHLPMMKQNIAKDLNCQQTIVNIKATTTEKLGFAGREEGIETHAVVLLQPL